MAKSEKKASFEENMAKLEETLEKLEQKDTPLEEAFELYKQGMETLKKCNDEIDLVEKKVLELKANGEVSEYNVSKEAE